MSTVRPDRARTHAARAFLHLASQCIAQQQHRHTCTVVADGDAWSDQLCDDDAKHCYTSDVACGPVCTRPVVFSSRQSTTLAAHIKRHVFVPHGLAALAFHWCWHETPLEFALLVAAVCANFARIEINHQDGYVRLCDNGDDDDGNCNGDIVLLYYHCRKLHGNIQAVFDVHCQAAVDALAERFAVHSSAAPNALLERLCKLSSHFMSNARVDACDEGFVDNEADSDYQSESDDESDYYDYLSESDSERNCDDDCVSDDCASDVLDEIEFEEERDGGEDNYNDEDNDNDDFNEDNHFDYDDDDFDSEPVEDEIDDVTVEQLSHNVKIMRIATCLMRQHIKIVSSEQNQK